MMELWGSLDIVVSGWYGWYVDEGYGSGYDSFNYKNNTERIKINYDSA